MSSGAAGPAPRPWPEELRLREQGTILTITFDNGERHDLAAEYLRVESPSAEVKGHGAGQEVTVAGKRHVSVRQIEPVGNYAISLAFSDGHGWVPAPCGACPASTAISGPVGAMAMGVLSPCDPVCRGSSSQFRLPGFLSGR